MKKCIICHSKKLKPMRVKEMMFGTNEAFEYMICSTCVSLSLSEVPKNLEDYYPENYYSFSNVNQNKLISSIKHQKDKHSLGEKNIIGYIFNLIFSEDSNLKAINYCNKAKSSAEILDIGSGGGVLLKKLCKHGYKKLYGIDPYLEKDKIEDGVVLRKKKVSDLVKEKRKYDIVILSHVLEHLQNPYKNLSIIINKIRKGGKLIIRVPISSSKAFEKFHENWFQIDAPRHLFVPSLKGVYIMANNLNLSCDYFFFDSTQAQFKVSHNYIKGIPLINQINTPLWKRISIKNLFYSLKSRILNKKSQGDQATFVFSQKHM